jgi:hypothetical protein
MSVRRTDYVVVGVRLPDEIARKSLYDIFDDDDVDALHNSVSTDSVGIIDSPMDGAWMVAGILIAPTGDIYSGLEFTEIDVNSVNLIDKARKVREFCKLLFDIDVEPKVLAFTQWS